MQCPNCGLVLDGMPANCPRCGQPLAQQPPQQQQPAPWGQSAPPSTPFGAYPPGYGPPYAPGQAAPPSMPLGTPAPPSYPIYPPDYQQPYPPGYQQPVPPGYQGPLPPGYQMGPGIPPFPPAPPRKVNTGLIVLSVVLAAVVVVAGVVGLLALARSGSSGPVATATATPLTPGATATSASSVLYDNTLLAPAPGWSNNQSCSFHSDGYHIKGFHLCFAPIGDQADVDVSVRLKQISGPTDRPHGVAFRHNSNPDRYEFDIVSDGAWVFFKCIAAQQKCVPVVDYRDNSAIHTGLNSSNTIEVRALGSHFVFSVNGTQVGTANDDTLANAGALALVGDDNTEVVFSHLTISSVD